MRAQVGQPNRTMARTNRVAALPGPLPHNLVGLRIDFRDRNLEKRGPHMSQAKRNLAALARDSNLDRSYDLATVHVDARNGAIALIEGPDRPRADRFKTRSRSCRNRIGYL